MQSLYIQAHMVPQRAAWGVAVKALYTEGTGAGMEKPSRV